ncbi:MAG: NAD(+)/NADH kinase [Romboutsia timonensis]
MVVINTGHLGFFAEFDPDEIDEFIELYKNNDFTIQEVHPLKGSICTKESSKDIYAVNEIVIKSVCSRTLHLDLRVNENKIQNFSGDGMLISTPIGSTAYNYSAGGSIIDPSLDTLQLTPLAPMNTIVYRSFTSSIVLSAKSTISIVPEYRFENSILVVVDGNEYRFNDITDIHIVRSDLKLKLLRRSDFEFWKRASEKFL